MNTKYEIKIYWSDNDSSFIAEIPELPGCSADGETYFEALGNLEKIRDLWLRNAQKYGDKIPKPKKAKRTFKRKPVHA
jgi:predicted RNase H-like HicB family nuclease